MTKRTFLASLCAISILTAVNGCASVIPSTQGPNTTIVENRVEDNTVATIDKKDIQGKVSTEPTEATEQIETTTIAETTESATKPTQKVETTTSDPLYTKRTDDWVDSPQNYRSGHFDIDEAKTIYKLVNEKRKENGLSELKWDETMYEAAKTRAQEITVCWNHTRPNGNMCFSVCDRIDGENLIKYYPSVDAAIEGWMNSQTHRENILRDWFTGTAVAVYIIDEDGGVFCAQEFTGCE